VGIDNFVTRKRVTEVGSWSATPIPTMARRLEIVRNELHKEITFHKGTVTDFEFMRSVLESSKPDAIVHLAEQRSAPYSMIDVHHAVTTQVENLTGTLNILYAMHEVCPDAHLVKMGTMGEYGTPNIDIAEGFLEVNYHGRTDYMPYPRQAGSWYHWSKVFDSGDVMFASKIWSLKATDVMQGVIYGIRTPEMTSNGLLTRFDFDDAWGTALNRFIVQAILGLPITPYGKGDQVRGFLALEDSMQSLRLAVENPPASAEYRVFNQFDAAYSVNHLAELTKKVAEEFGFHPTIEHPPNPRVEAEQHYYNPIHEHLPKLGYKATRTIEEVVRELFRDLKRYKRRLEARRHVVQATVQWGNADNHGVLAARAPKAPASLPTGPGPESADPSTP
jgi:UDP-sulfoquinovose synthase